MPLETTTTWLRDALQRGGALPTDRDLLARFAGGDEAAFAELVRRHGPLVLGVCERVLGNRTDAEDAYQATFLALADRAGRSDWRESVSGWLHAVAWRTATKARVRAARQRTVERQVPGAGRQEDAELVEALDEEVRRLPPTLREAVVCCYLQGLTRPQAAAKLGWSLRTLDRRLEDGRRRLRERLESRGLPIPALLAGPAVSLTSLLGRWWLVTALVLVLGAGVVAFPRPAAPHAAAPPVPQPAQEALPRHALARLGETRWRHGSGVTHLAFSPDGKVIASSGSGRGLCLWDAASGTLVRDYSDLFRTANTTAFSADGKRVVAADVGFYVADLATAKVVHYLNPHRAQIGTVAWSDDGRWLATASFDEPLVLWDAARGKQVKADVPDANRLPIGQREVAFSPGSKFLAAATPGGVILWDPAAGKELNRLPLGGKLVGSIAFTADGKHLAYADSDGVHLLATDVKAPPRTLAKWEPTSGGRVIAVSPDGKTLAAGSTLGVVQIIALDTGKEVRRWAAHAFAVRALAYSPDGKVLATGCHLSGAIRRWDPRTGAELGGDSGHKAPIAGLRVSPDGKTLVSAAMDGQVVRWDLATRAAKTWSQPVLGSMYWLPVAVAPDGKSIALARVGESDNTVGMFDVTTGTRRLLFDGHRDAVIGVDFSQSGQSLVSNSHDGTIRVWDLATGRQRLQIDLPPAGRTRTWSRRAVRFSPDDRMLLMLGTDNVARLYDAATGRERFSNSSSLDVPAVFLYGEAFSPDGTLLALSRGLHQPTIQLLDTRTGKVVRTWEQAGSEMIQTMTFSPDGRLLATAGTSKDSVVRLWDVERGAEIVRFGGHRGGIFSLTFTPDARALASGGGDGHVLLWDVTGRHGKPAVALTPQRLQELWAALADRDVKKAHAAVWELAQSPAEAVPFLRTRLAPVEPADRATLDRLAQQLDAEAFSDRERASADLQQLGGAAVPRLRQLLDAKSSLEAHKRAEAILTRYLTGDDWQRTRRALAALDHANTNAATKLLEELSRGAPGAPLTEAAQSILARR